MQLSTIFVIDGSGHADHLQADRKRPIYRLDGETGEITRPLLPRGGTALEFLTAQIDSGTVPKPVLIAADVPIGLPERPEDVFAAAQTGSFLGWLDATSSRLEPPDHGWRELLIAEGVAARSAMRPFVSIGKGEKKGEICFLRRCDRQSRGESVYCLDHGGKQVGRAAMQFWFELLVPLKRRYGSRLVVWPFEPWAGSEVIVGECYPAECHRRLYRRVVRKRQPLEVAAALNGLLAGADRRRGIETECWVHAASSEDEFDMFTTALAFRELVTAGEDLFAYPVDDPACRRREGWMIGLSVTNEVKQAASKPRTGSLADGPRPAVALTRGRNRHDQEDCGRSGNRGVKGPLHLLKCHRPLAEGGTCGHEYETNAQDVFQKRCPACQS